MESKESTLEFDILVRDAAPGTIELQRILQERLSLVARGKYVNGHHPNSDTIARVQNRDPEAEELFLDEYGWVAALGAHQYAKQATEDPDRLFKKAEAAIVEAAHTYSASEEDNFVRHASRLVTASLAELTELSPVPSLYEDEDVQKIFTPYAKKEEVVQPASPKRILPGRRQAEDLPPGLDVYCVVADSIQGDLKIVRGKVKHSRAASNPNSDTSFIYPENNAALRRVNPGIVRVEFKEAPCALIADVNYCGIVPVESAGELIEDKDFADKWFGETDEGQVEWSAYKSRYDFIDKLGKLVEREAKTGR